MTTQDERLNEVVSGSIIGSSFQHNVAEKETNAFWKYGETDRRYAYRNGEKDRSS